MLNNNYNLRVNLPLTSHTGKIRIKRRKNVNEYGVPVATKTNAFTDDCYVEWQIGYDAEIQDEEKLAKTIYPQEIFTGANGNKKALYELSQYIKDFYEQNIISKNDLLDIKNYLTNIKPNDYLDSCPELKINRREVGQRSFNDYNFDFKKIEYPILIYNFHINDFVAEVVIREKQYAVGIQPMLYLCFPITNLKSENTNDNLLGRTAKAKEEAYFIIDKDNIKVFLNMFKLFGTLSSNHNKDVISIIDIILK